MVACRFYSFKFDSKKHTLVSALLGNSVFFSLWRVVVSSYNIHLNNGSTQRLNRWEDINGISFI